MPERTEKDDRRLSIDVQAENGTIDVPIARKSDEPGKIPVRQRGGRCASGGRDDLAHRAERRPVRHVRRPTSRRNSTNTKNRKKKEELGSGRKDTRVRDTVKKCKRIPPGLVSVE